VAENIRRFAHRADASADERTIAAARAAGAHDMILQLPQGYETIIGDDGRGLSVGQTQRIALARALYGAPALLVLDEPNAHLDSAGEIALIQAVRETKARGGSVMLIAHRAGVLACADKLLVLNNGRIEQFGSADEVTHKLAAAANNSKTVVLPQRGTQ
jgi:ABC-type protease/lipase transport system fused ATPase/permease subunit